MKITCTIALFAFFTFSMAQENIGFQQPSAEILKLADYQRAPSIFMDSKKEWLIFSYRPTYKSLEDLNQDEMRLAGLRINPATNISSSISYFNNLRIRRINEKVEREIKNLPTNPKIVYLSLSPDEKKIAFTNTTKNGVELWYVDLESAIAKKLTSDNLNANLGMPYIWNQDSQNFLIKVIPINRPALINEKQTLPIGPTVSNSDGKISQNRTYPDLLKNPQDESNFETLAQSELYSVDLNGSAKKLKNTDLYSNVSYSPDGNYLMLTTIKKPFSYIVPLNRFPMTTTVYDKNGNLVKVVNEVPLNEVLPKGFSSTITGKRSMEWRSDMPATLVFAQALDGGDQSKKVEFRDELFLWDSPFSEVPKSFFKTKDRYSGTAWSDDQYAVVSEMWYDTRILTSNLINLKDGTSRVLEKRNFQDVYSDPGDFNQIKNKYGKSVIAIENGKAFLIGAGFSKEGQHPFIDELGINSLKKKRLYTSKLTNSMESIRDLIDSKKGEILTVVQSPSQYPNYYLKNMKSGKSTAITNFPNPFESIKEVYKEVIKYKRNDGIELTGTLYLPANYDRKSHKEKLPMLIWAYPAEYKDKNTAGQNTQNPYEFTFPSYGSFIYWVAKGYAVLDDAAFPIIGEGKTEPNDTFIPQLVANGKAAIDAVDNLGYIDRKRVAVGGHSYGAFMTANLLTHSNLFACGIARSGAYNRTLTPFGFQNEQRNYWDVPNVYNEMSPFMNADKMNTPLLLIHGDADNNPGTFTLQTERYFQALKNLGKPVRMVLLPKEQHGYVSRENIMHVLWEQEQFLDKCLKK